MQKPFINHPIRSIGDEGPLASSAADAVLQHVNEVAEKIRELKGQDVVDRVLSYQEVIRALEQCKKYSKKSDSSITRVDNYIYYDFLYRALGNAEKVIDDEMSEYNF